MKNNSLPSTVSPSLNLANASSGFRLALRPLWFGLIIGLGVGLATKNLAVGLALGVAFTALNGTFGCRAK